jgi:hypothetical protein
MTGAGKTHTMLGDIYRNSTGEIGIYGLTVSKKRVRFIGSKNVHDHE